MYTLNAPGHASRLGKPTVEPGDPIDILSVQSPLWRVHEGDTTHLERITWALAPRSATWSS